MATPRESLIACLRRRGCANPPLFLQLCPALVERFRKETGSTQSYPDYFGLSFQYVDDARLPDRAAIDWARYYPEGVKPGTVFDDWGVGHEPGSAEAMHMTRMLHPLEHCETLEEIQAYPYPDFARADYSHIPPQIAALHARGVGAAFAMSDMTWEISWYLRRMEVLIPDMCMEDEKAVWLLDKTTEQAVVRARKYAGSWRWCLRPAVTWRQASALWSLP